MEFTDTQLLIAAHILHRAESFKLARSRDMDDAERKAYMALPANDVIAEAWDELKGIATVLAKIQAPEAESRPAGQEGHG